MLFTIFTPTYNRAETLKRLYDSLLSQTFQEFEWVIVDDGSDDNTKEIVNSWQKASIIDIRYEFQSNSGKHVAYNRGVQLARGKLFLNVDSDDYLLPDALEIFSDAWRNIPPEKRTNFTGVSALGIDQNGAVIGDNFPSDVFDVASTQKNYKYKIKGDKCGFHRTEILKLFPFPEMPEHKFYAEGIIWSKIGRYYKTRYLNKPVCVFGYDGGNQLSNKDLKVRARNRIFYAHYLNVDANFIWVAPLQIFKFGIQGTRYSFHNGDRLKAQLSWIDNNNTARLIWLAAMPFGFVLYFFENFIKHRRVR